MNAKKTAVLVEGGDYVPDPSKIPAHKIDRLARYFLNWARENWTPELQAEFEEWKRQKAEQADNSGKEKEQ